MHLQRQIDMSHIARGLSQRRGRGVHVSVTRRRLRLGLPGHHERRWAGSVHSPMRRARLATCAQVAQPRARTRAMRIPATVARHPWRCAPSRAAARALWAAARYECGPSARGVVLAVVGPSHAEVRRAVGHEVEAILRLVALGVAAQAGTPVEVLAPGVLEAILLGAGGHARGVPALLVGPAAVLHAGEALVEVLGGRVAGAEGGRSGQLGAVGREGLRGRRGLLLGRLGRVRARAHHRGHRACRE
mmetsp:Transcript_21922/g.73732  ORF Transcript_21922/g.73732 Transcript_21922/m.73732 type:complete len:246 (-) Transcript_21922:501-1238(-)